MEFYNSLYLKRGEAIWILQFAFLQDYSMNPHEYWKKITFTIMQFLNTTNKYETSKAISSCNKSGPPIPPKAMEIYSHCGSKEYYLKW
jgi:hypothetical protein